MTDRKPGDLPELAEVEARLRQLYPQHLAEPPPELDDSILVHAQQQAARRAPPRDRRPFLALAAGIAAITFASALFWQSTAERRGTLNGLPASAAPAQAHDPALDRAFEAPAPVEDGDICLDALDDESPRAASGRKLALLRLPKGQYGDPRVAETLAADAFKQFKTAGLPNARVVLIGYAGLQPSLHLVYLNERSLCHADGDCPAWLLDPGANPNQPAARILLHTLAAPEVCAQRIKAGIRIRLSHSEGVYRHIIEHVWSPEKP